MSSNFYRQKYIETEEAIANVALAGVKKTKTGNNELELDDRLEQLYSLRSYYLDMYNKALADENGGGCPTSIGRGDYGGI